MKRNVLKLALLFSVSLNVAVLGVTAYHRFLGEHDSGQRASGREELFQELTLSAEQQREFNRLRSEFHDSRRRHDARMKELRRALLAELVSETPDMTRIEELLPAMSEQQAAIERKLVDHLLSEKALLRPEQRLAFRRVLERHILSPEERHRSEDNSGTR